MSVLGDIREAIMDSLSTLGINHDGGYLGSSIAPPWFELSIPSDGYQYDTTYHRGTDTVTMILRGVVQIGDPVEAQQNMDSWLDPTGSTSVKALVETDTTLGGLVDDLRVVSVRPHLRIPPADAGNVEYLCSEWTLDISISP